MIHSFLIIGQSNMAGRGNPNEVEPVNNDKIQVLRNGRWHSLYVPVNADRATSGINLSESFADMYARDRNVSVGIIPCADGGSCIDQWMEGGLLFDHACYLCELASRTSTIAGVLWHQGESDCREEKLARYEEKLSAVLNAFRKRLDLYDVPFLLGGLGDYLKDCEKYPYLKNYTRINDIIKSVAKNSRRTGYVCAKGLEPNDDNLHFCAKALREFGVRYYREFLKYEDKNKVFTEKVDNHTAMRSELERL